MNRSSTSNHCGETSRGQSQEVGRLVEKRGLDCLAYRSSSRLSTDALPWVHEDMSSVDVNTYISTYLV